MTRMPKPALFLAVVSLLYAGSATGGEEKQGKGKLTVVSTPWSKVKVDGLEVGDTPVKGHALKSGTHQVELVNEGMELSFSMTVTVKDGKETKISHVFEVESTKGTGTLTVTTSPWAEVYVDGEFLGNTPVLRHGLEPGKHVVKLVNDGMGISETLSVTVEDGMDVTINKKLESKPKTGTLSVSTHPWAKVFVNGVELGTTPITKHRLEPGTYKVKLVNEPLGIEKTLSVKIKKGKHTKVTKDLTAKPKGAKGTLSVTTTPWTTVYVDGKKVGNTPLVKLGLSPGKHTVKLVNENHGIEETLKVKILKGEDTKIVRNLSH